MPNPVADAAERFRAAALARERATATRLVQAYGRVYRTLQQQISAMEATGFGVARVDVGQPLSARDMQQVRYNMLHSLRPQIIEQMRAFGVYAEQTVLQAMENEIPIAQRDAEGLVRAHFDPDYIRQSAQAQAAISASWNRLPVEAIETMIGMTGTDSPLHGALVERLGPALADHAIEQLTTGIALGRNPRVVARQIMGAGLNWALTTARTAQLNAYREATRSTYMANSHIVSGWRWHAALSPRTCISCLAKHGTVYPVTERLQDHHNGRCTAIPIVPLAQRMGIPEPRLGDSEAWFNAQPESVQRNIMGPGIWEGYRAGRWNFRSLTTTYEDHVYGTMWRAPTLRALEQEAQR